jgi:hypothetical protein
VGETCLRTFEEFFKGVKDSCEGHAKRKNYTSGGVDDDNQLATVVRILGVSEHHAIGEIVYKCAEFLKAPTATKKILLEKIAGWAWILYRDLPD